jgi:hypothetical protein
MSRYKVSPTNR